MTRHVGTVNVRGSSICYLNALDEVLIRTILALVDSITQVGDEDVGVWVLDMVALEDALALVITHPVTRTADLGLVGDHCAGNCAEID